MPPLFALQLAQLIAYLRCDWLEKNLFGVQINNVRVEGIGKQLLNLQLAGKIDKTLRRSPEILLLEAQRFYKFKLKPEFSTGR